MPETKVVQELKDYLTPKRAELNEDVFKGGACLEREDIEEVRVEVAYQIIWNRAQNVSYPDFYHAWTGASDSSHDLRSRNC